MKRSRIYALLSIFAGIVCSCIGNVAAPEFMMAEGEAGLRFSAHTVPLEKRTGLDLTSDGPFHFRGGFRLDFDISLRHEEHNYGYISRIIINDTLNIDFLTNAGWEDNSFRLTVGKRTCMEFPKIDSIPDFGFGRWNTVSMTVGRKSVCVGVNGCELETAVSLPRLNDVRIFFGRCSSEHFTNTDVPPMSIRNVEIRRSSGKLLCRFPLSRHGKDFSLDETGNRKATASNPEWEIDRHVCWESLGKMIYDGYIPQVAYCDTPEYGGCFIIAAQDSVHIWKLEDGSVSGIRNESGFPYKSTANCLVYDSSENELVSYSVSAARLNRFSFRDRKWSFGDDSVYHSMLHNNGILLRDRRRIAVFGGYDMYRYNASLYFHDIDGEGWTKETLSGQLEPRYLSAMAYDGEGHLYVLGGYGSRTGSQWESPVNFNDLVEINIDSLTAAKIWNFKAEGQEVFGNGMVYDRDADRFYALSFNNDRTETKIRLNSFGRPDGDRKIYADEIPFTFYDLHSYCTLVRTDNRLIAMAISGISGGRSEIRFYGMDYPPLSVDDVFQAEPKTGVLWRWGVLAAVMISAAYGFWLWKNRFRGRAVEESVPEDVPEEISSQPEAGSDIGGPELNLLGYFRYVDKDGKDETAAFSHTMRNIFAYMVISETKEGKGVTSRMIDETFWDSDDAASTANKRNVAMSRLRMVLKKFGMAELTHKSGLWSIMFENDVRCDFTEVLPLLTKCASGKPLDQDETETVLNLCSRGPLLANVEEEWCDSLKSWWLMLISDAVQKLMGYPGMKGNPHMEIRLSDIMLANDPLDEDAMKIKCQALCRIGKSSQAKNIFESFKIRYIKMLGEAPKINFENFLSL